MGTESSTNVVLISHEIPNSWADTVGVALEDALSVHTVHLDGDCRRYLDQRSGQPALVLIYDADFARTLETVQRWRIHHPDEPILVVTPEQDEDRLMRVYRAGADECIHAGIGLPLLMAKLRVWMRWIVMSDVESDPPLSAS